MGSTLFMRIRHPAMNVQKTQFVATDTRLAWILGIGEVMLTVLRFTHASCQRVVLEVTTFHAKRAMEVIYARLVN